ncbi:MAG: hypothetical protein ABL889_22375 [Terricaulis sp.]
MNKRAVRNVAPPIGAINNPRQAVSIIAIISAVIAHAAPPA